MFKNIYHLLEEIFSQLKDPLIAFLTAVGLFLGPIADLVVATILFAMLDFLTAISAATKNKIPVTSEKMGDTFPKIILYSIAIICMHFLDLYVVNTIKTGFLDFFLKIFLDQEAVMALNAAKLTSAVAFLIVIREMKSVDENWKLTFGWSFWGTIKTYIINPLITLKNKTKKDGTKEN